MTKRGYWLFFALAIVWGIPYFFIKLVVEEISPAGDDLASVLPVISRCPRSDRTRQDRQGR